MNVFGLNSDNRLIDTFSSFLNAPKTLALLLSG